MEQEELNGIKFVWNTLPATRSDTTKIVIPVGFHYTPGQQNENMQLLEYDPLTCHKCKAVISPLFSFSTKDKKCECSSAILAERIILSIAFMYKSIWQSLSCFSSFIKLRRQSP